MRGMSGIPQSFQRRTDDLYLLKTRNLVFENVDGTFPVKGALAYTTNKVGAVGFSTVTADAAGNLTVPGTTTMGANAYVVVEGETGLLTATQDVDIYGKLIVYNTAQVNALELLNTTDSVSVSQLYDSTVGGVETLNWTNAAGVSEPISGWNAKITPSTGIFRTVDTTGLTGATLIMAQNQNALLTLFQQRGVFLTTLTADPTLAAVFNTTVAITFRLTPTLGAPVDITFSVPGNSALTVSYTDIADRINTAAVNILFGNPDLSLVASYVALGTTGTFTFTVGADTTLQFVDSTTNGTAQLFLNHLNTASPLLTNTSYTTNQASATVQDFTEVMPATPIAGPTIESYDISNCTIGIPAFPPTPIAIQNIGIYWCLSGTAFSSSPNAIVSADTETYTITDLSGGATYNIALSYRSLYDESPKGPSAQVKTFGSYLVPYLQPGLSVYSVEVTEDVNWLSTPSYGTSTVNYGKQYMSNVKFTVATVFSAIWANTLEDLTKLTQIQSVTIDFYAGAATAVTDARFFTGLNPLTNILYSGPSSVEPKYGDAVGLGGSAIIYADAGGIDMLREIFNADSAGNIGVGKNMVFGWYCTQGGLRNCEMTRLNVIYTV
jgi:hypothetical protein